MTCTRTRLSAGTMLLAALVVTSASATVIDFSGLSGSNGDAFTTFTESGYTISKTSGSGCVAKNFGNPVPDVFGGPTCDTGTSGTFALTGPGLFSFNDIDLSANNGILSYAITGKIGASTVWTQTSSLSGPTATFSTIAGAFSTPVDSVTFGFTTAGTSWNFDNIVVTAARVPEPATLALLGLGLAGLGFSRRKQ